MARTLVGTLLLNLRQNVTSEGKRVQAALAGIDAAVTRLNGATRGSSFQRQIDRFAVSPQQLAAIQTSWGKLQSTLSGMPAKDGSKAMSTWKAGVLSHLTALESGIGRNIKQAGKLKALLGDIGRMGLVAAGGYTAFYLGGKLINEGITAGSERDRANFRLDMANIPAAEQVNLRLKAQALSSEYRGVSATDILYSYLGARSAMGDEARTMAVLEPLVQGLTVLQSVRGPDVAQDVMDRIMKSADVLGLNMEGPDGIKNVTSLIDYIIRAAQYEGRDFDPGAYLEFARGTKVAGLGMDPEFLSAVVPALIQDMGAPQVGKALATEFKSFVLGDASMNGKLYKARQTELGIRDENGLIGADLMTRNPYEWTKEYLVTALEAKGYDTTDETLMSQIIGSLSGNSNATGAMTRMVLQQAQLNKAIAGYHNSMGLEAAKDASERDPFVAAAGVGKAFANLAGNLAEHVHVIVPVLNAITDAINSFASTLLANPLLAQIVAGTAAGGGVLAAGGMIAAIFSLGTAGPALNLAATNLNIAAGNLGAGGAAGGAAGKGGWVAGAAVGGAVIGATAIAAYANATDPKLKDARQVRDDALSEMFGEIAGFISGAAGSLGASAPPADGLPYTGPYSLYDPRSTAAPQADMVDVQTQIDAATAKARESLSGISGTVVRPQVDTSSIDAANSKVERLISNLQKLSVGSAPNTSRIDAEIARANADYGVAP